MPRLASPRSHAHVAVPVRFQLADGLLPKLPVWDRSFFCPPGFKMAMDGDELCLVTPGQESTNPPRRRPHDMVGRVERGFGDAAAARPLRFATPARCARNARH